MEIIITAATSWEARPLVARWALESQGGCLYEGRVGGRTVRLIQTGVGPEATTRSLSGIETGPEFTAISSGLAGGLQPGLRPGDLVADLREAPAELVEAARAAAREAGVTLHFGAVASTDRGLWKPAEKAAAGLARRAAAVDMESEAVRNWCRSRGGLFLAARAVFDAMEEELPGDALDVDETMAGRLRYGMRHWRELPFLARLYFRQRRAMSGLARFLERFLTEVQAPVCA